jgi:hypothetical protein
MWESEQTATAWIDVNGPTIEEVARNFTEFAQQMAEENMDMIIDEAQDIAEEIVEDIYNELEDVFEDFFDQDDYEPDYDHDYNNATRGVSHSMVKQVDTGVTTEAIAAGVIGVHAVGALAAGALYFLRKAKAAESTRRLHESLIGDDEDTL